MDYICERVNRCIDQFKGLCFKPSLEIRKLLVVPMIFPIFDYVNAAFFDLNVTLLTRLQRAQYSRIRRIFCLHYNDHVTPNYKQLTRTTTKLNNA